MELKLIGKTIIAAVGQRPFACGGNTFCKLIPLFNHLNADDKTLDPKDFYNDGEIWWRLSQSTNPESIIPGMLMETTLEPSQEKSEDPGKSLYQARFGEKEDVLEPTAGAELFRLGNETTRSLMRSRGGDFPLRLPHISAKMTYLAVEGWVYGPLAAFEAPGEGFAGGWAYVFKALIEVEGKPTAFRMREDEFSKRYEILGKEVTVSIDEKGRLSNHKAKVVYEFLAPETCRDIGGDLPSDWEKVDWEPLAQKFVRMASAARSFSRSDRQQMKDLLKRLEESSEANGYADELGESLKDVDKLSKSTEAAFIAMGATLLDCGLMDKSRYDKAMELAAEDWIKKHRGELEAKVHELTERRDDLERKAGDLENQIRRDRDRRRENQKQEEQKLKAQLAKTRDKAMKEIEAERAAWEAKKSADLAEIDGRRRQLDAVLAEIKTSPERSAAGALEILPFLKEMLAAAKPEPAKDERREAERMPRPEPFRAPKNIYVPSQAAKNAVAETEFLQRLGDYAMRQGLSYDPDDLRRFHLSVVCEGLTILEGPAGVGKSSLARVYGDVLAGAGAEYPRNGTHVVHVSPSWMERADLLGYVNTVTAEFSPSETGLYQHLIMAEIDYRENDGASALYPVCLDEMNLAQVEHYFSDFMQVMEMPEGKRTLPCFSKDAVSPDAVFREHSKIELAPSVRFIGTVNFDETTRRLSSRLLDRANLVYIGEGQRPVAQARAETADPGVGVSLSTFDSWRRSAALPQSAERTLASISAPLRTLGVAVSPRVRSGMARYIESARPLLGGDAEAVAFDEQLAQRVLSKVRSITSVAQKKALDELADAVGSLRDDAGSPSRAAIERLRSKEHFFGYESEA